MPLVETYADRRISLRGLEFHYRDWGGQGQPVALLHGLASNCRIWDMVAPELARQCRVVALDQRGHGRSDKPESGYDFPSVVADVRAFIEALGLARPIVAGHSWGGDVALELAVACPDAAKGLVFVDGGMIQVADRPGATLEQAKRDMAPPDFTGWRPEMFRQRVAGRFADSPDPDLAAEITLANFHTLPDGTIRANLSRANHLRIIEALWEHHPALLYPRVSCPTLLLPARMKADPAQQERTLRRAGSAAQASRLLPRNKLVWLEDSIHDVPLQRPGLVARTILEHIASGFFD